MAKCGLPGLRWLLVILLISISFLSLVKCQSSEGLESNQKLRDQVFKYTNVSIDDIDPGTLLEWLYPGTASEDSPAQVRTIRVSDSVEKSDHQSEATSNTNNENIQNQPEITSRSDYSPTESYVGPTGPSAQQSGDQHQEYQTSAVHPNSVVEHQQSFQDQGYLPQSQIQSSVDHSPQNLQYHSSAAEYPQHQESNSVPPENEVPTYQNYQGYSTSENNGYQPNSYPNFPNQQYTNIHQGSSYIYTTPSPQFYANPIPPPPVAVNNNQPLNYQIPLKQPQLPRHHRPTSKPRFSWFEKQRRHIYDRFREHKKRRRQAIDGAHIPTHYPAEAHLPPLVAHHHHLLPVDHAPHHPHPIETPDPHAPFYPEGPQPLPPPPSVGPEGPHPGEPLTDEVLQSLLSDPAINTELESLYGELATLDQGRTNSTPSTNTTSGNFIANLLGLTSNPSTGSSMFETMMMPVMFMTLSMFTMDIFGRLFPMGNPFDRMDSRNRRRTTTTTTVKPKVTRIQIAPPPIPIISDLIELKTAKIKAAQKEIEDKYERRKNKYQNGWADSSEETPWWRLRSSSKSGRAGLKKRRKKKSSKAPKWSLKRLHQLYDEQAKQREQEEQLRILMGVQ